MVYWTIIFIIFLLSFWLEQSVLVNFFPTQYVPHIVLVLVVFFSLRRDLGRIWKELILAGILADIFYFSFFGVNVLSFIFLSFFVNYLSRRFLSTYGKTKILALFMIAFVAFGTYEIITLAIEGLYAYLRNNQEFLLASLDWIRILRTSLTEMILLAILYPLLDKSEKIIFKEKVAPSIK